MLSKGNYDPKSGIRYDIEWEDPKTGKWKIKNPTLSEIAALGVVAGIAGILGLLGGKR